jgi:hypothetical protein
MAVIESMVATRPEAMATMTLEDVAKSDLSLESRSVIYY